MDVNEGKVNKIGRRWPFLVGLVLFFASSVAWMPDVLRPGVVQPLLFSHKTHTEEAELECSACHATVETRAFAGLPKVSLCMECHEEPQTESLAEAKLIKYGEAGKEIPWVRLFRQPGHVFYSHRRHVAQAGLECATCHGDMNARKASDTSWPEKLTMETCVACHEDQGAGTDCTDCHR